MPAASRLLVGLVVAWVACASGVTWVRAGSVTAEIDGVWQMTRYNIDGRTDKDRPKQDYRIIISKGKWTVTHGGNEVGAGKVTLDAQKKPKQFVFVDGEKGGKVLGIYEVNGTELKIAQMSNELEWSTTRPENFTERKGVKVAVYKKAKGS